MKQIFTLTVQGESEAEVLACLAKMNSEAALSVIVGQIGAGCISDGSYPTVQWTYKAAQPTEQPDARKLYTVKISNGLNDYDAGALLTDREQEEISAALDVLTESDASRFDGTIERNYDNNPLDFVELQRWITTCTGVSPD